MHKTRLCAFMLLLVMCVACFTACLPYDLLLSYLQQANDDKMEELTYQTGGTHIITDEGITYQVTLPDHWITSGATPGALVAKTNDGNVEAIFIMNSGNKTVEKTWMQRVEIHEDNGAVVEYGKGPAIQGNNTAWLLVDGVFQYLIHIPHTNGNCYLLLYVDDMTGTDSFLYLEELASSVVVVPNK